LKFLGQGSERPAYETRRSSSETAVDQEPGVSDPRFSEATPRTSPHEAEIRKLTTQLGVELETEYAQTLPERVQKSTSIFELSIYSPTIEETWKGTGIRRLKIDGPINEKWREILKAVVIRSASK
jgi:hypothetical protein